MKKEIKASFDLYNKAKDYQQSINDVKHQDIKDIECFNNHFISNFADDIEEVQSLSLIHI